MTVFLDSGGVLKNQIIGYAAAFLNHSDNVLGDYAAAWDVGKDFMIPIRTGISSNICRLFTAGRDSLVG
jgi:hypothetical protein